MPEFEVEMGGHRRRPCAEERDGLPGGDGSAYRDKGGLAATIDRSPPVRVFDHEREAAGGFALDRAQSPGGGGQDGAAGGGLEIQPEVALGDLGRGEWPTILQGEEERRRSLPALQGGPGHLPFPRDPPPEREEITPELLGIAKGRELGRTADPHEPLEPVMDVEKAFEERERLVHPDLGSYSYMKGVFFPQPGTNIAHHQKIRKGNIDDGFAHADVVTEYEFWNPPVQHVAMETHTSIVQAKPEGKVDIISSAQSPYAVRNLFAHAFGIPHANIRVRVPYVGGGFGGKAGIHLEPLLYCLSKAAKGRPVKLTCTREEEFNTMPSRQGL